MNKSSLRRQLVLPYVLLVIFVSTAIAWISFQAGEDAVQSLCRRIMKDMAERVSTATEQRLATAQTVLHAIAQAPSTSLQSPPLSNDLASIEERLWIASGWLAEAGSYAYFGSSDGRFAGVRRSSEGVAELPVQDPRPAHRQVYSGTAPGGRAHLLRIDNNDVRNSTWYRTAVGKRDPVWSPVHHDSTSGEPVITLAKAVYRADGSLAGVFATDVSLKILADFLRGLDVSEGGIAFVVDREGYVIATNGRELPLTQDGNEPRRLRAIEMPTPSLRQAYLATREWRDRGTDRERQFAGATGDIEIAASTIARQDGLDWTAIVAVPRSTFLKSIAPSFAQAIFLAALCIILALVIGLSILNRVLEDIRKLTDAAKRVGEGEPLPSLNIRRRDEIGQLAMSFSEMEYNMRIDKLTAVFNRASLISQIGSLRRQLESKTAERPSFALLFIDLDHFKSINDQYGHDAGDRVLVAVATRLKESVRATDVVARYGGDEFVVLLKGVTEAADIIAAEEKIGQIVEAPIPLDHGQVCVGVSIGWAMFPEDGDDVNTLLKIADTRMFDTKKARKAAL